MISGRESPIRWNATSIAHPSGYDDVLHARCRFLSGAVPPDALLVVSLEKEKNNLAYFSATLSDWTIKPGKMAGKAIDFRCHPGRLYGWQGEGLCLEQGSRSGGSMISRWPDTGALSQGRNPDFKALPNFNLRNRIFIQAPHETYSGYRRPQVS